MEESTPVLLVTANVGSIFEDVGLLIYLHIAPIPKSSSQPFTYLNFHFAARLDVTTMGARIFAGNPMALFFSRFL